VHLEINIIKLNYNKITLAGFSILNISIFNYFKKPSYVISTWYADKATTDSLCCQKSVRSVIAEQVVLA